MRSTGTTNTIIGSGFARRPSLDGSDQSPHWNAVLHELWLGDVLVKRFRRPAPVPELILAAFEEDDWQQHIDDPLPPRAGCLRTRRLRDAIHNLNRRLDHLSIRFSLNGHGDGIKWSVSTAVSLNQPVRALG